MIGIIRVIEEIKIKYENSSLIENFIKILIDEIKKFTKIQKSIFDIPFNEGNERLENWIDDQLKNSKLL